MPRRASGTRPPAIVVGLDSLQGIQCARILDGHGIPVVAIAEDRSHPNCRTNVCRDLLIAPTGTPELVDTLLELGADLDERAALFPCQDKSVRVISRHREQLEPFFAYALPPPEVVETFLDKVRFLEHAEAHGVRVPPAVVIRSRSDAERAARELAFPCLLKPSYRTTAWDSHTKRKVFMLANGEELLQAYETCRTWSEAFIAQRWVRGDDSNLYSCNCYFDHNGKPLATFVARKLRQWPVDAGSSCFGEEVRDDPTLAGTLEFFGTVPYHGLAYLELKKDDESGDYYVIEPNVGRPTGRSAIAEAGGVQLLYTMYCDVLQLPLPPIEERTQRYAGTKWVDLRHDVQSGFTYWRSDRLGFGEWLRSYRGSRAHALFDWRDPAPFLADLWLAAKEARERLVRPGGAGTQ
jgi:predicted ATP-grasp superfamily ATP-dependent carboligase